GRAKWAIRRSPPAHEHDVAPQARQRARRRVQPVLDVPLARGLAEQLIALLALVTRVGLLMRLRRQWLHDEQRQHTRDPESAHAIVSTTATAAAAGQRFQAVRR